MLRADLYVFSRSSVIKTSLCFALHLILNRAWPILEAYLNPEEKTMNYTIIRTLRPIDNACCSYFVLNHRIIELYSEKKKKNL